MSFEVKKVSGVTRIVDSETGKIARSVHGKPVDGGRQNAKTRGPTKAHTQARYINEAVNVKAHHGHT